MKKLVTACIFAMIVVSSACSDKEAQDYAAKLIPVLDSYQEQLSLKIKTEKDFYEDLASTFEEARVDDIKIRLTAERSIRSKALAEDIFDDDKPPKLSTILDALQDYAKHDFETTRTMLDEQMDSRSKYLADLEGLEIDLQKIKTLKESLLDLSKSKSALKRFKDTGEFLSQSEEGVNTLLCADFKKTLEDLTAEKTDLESQIAASADVDKKNLIEVKKKRVESQIKRLQERSKDRKCK